MQNVLTPKDKLVYFLIFLFLLLVSMGSLLLLIKPQSILQYLPLHQSLPAVKLEVLDEHDDITVGINDAKKIDVIISKFPKIQEQEIDTIIIVFTQNPEQMTSFRWGTEKYFAYSFTQVANRLYITFFIDAKTVQNYGWSANEAAHSSEYYLIHALTYYERTLLPDKGSVREENANQELPIIEQSIKNKSHEINAINGGNLFWLVYE